VNEGYDQYEELSKDDVQERVGISAVSDRNHAGKALAFNGQEYYQGDMVFSEQEVIPDFRFDVEKFLKSVNHKKKDMMESREEVIKKIRFIVEKVHSIEGIEIFGSFKTNLDLPWSDIDFVAFSNMFNGSDCLDELHNHLFDEKQNSDWITKIEYISSASVPIIKLETAISTHHIKVDITFGDETHKGSQTVSLIKRYLSLYPILGPITMIIKQLLKSTHLNDPYSGGISSYAITLLAVAFLQFQKLY
jgi:non-canonical poly(A) RNA polymerase PAPD5/7